MGITIHFDLSYEGSEHDLIGLLNTVKEIGSALEFKDVANAPVKYSKRLREGGLAEGWVIEMRFDDGCEPTNIGLVTMDGTHWTGRSYTKTQYSKDFIKCHLSVILLLEGCKKLGLLKDVYDESKYWETRDIKTLGDKITQSTDYISNAVGILKSKFGVDVVVSPIDKCKNIVNVEDKKHP